MNGFNLRLCWKNDSNKCFTNNWPPNSNPTLFQCQEAPTEAASHANFSNKRQQLEQQILELLIEQLNNWTTTNHVLNLKILFDLASTANVPKQCSKKMIEPMLVRCCFYIRCLAVICLALFATTLAPGPPQPGCGERLFGPSPKRGHSQEMVGLGWAGWGWGWSDGMGGKRCGMDDGEVRSGGMGRGMGLGLKSDGDGSGGGGGWGWGACGRLLFWRLTYFLVDLHLAHFVWHFIVGRPWVWDLQKFADFFRNLQKFVEICRHLHKFAEIYRNLQKLGNECRN